MNRKSKKRVLPVANVSVMDKRFAWRWEPSHVPVHELIVLMDLQKGVLTSLDRYLAKHKGIPDRRIAVALRKLISGTLQRSSYRLIVVQHPDLPPDSGGAPKRQRSVTAQRQREIVERVEALVTLGDKRGIAIETVASELGVSKRTVQRSLQEAAQRKQSQDYRRDVEQNLAKGMSRREAILAAVKARDEK